MPAKDPQPRPETLCARAGEPPVSHTRPSVAPIWQTAAFDIDGLSQLAELSSGKLNGHIYTRDSNPNHDAFAADVARLEAAEAGAVCASGMGAIAATLLSVLNTGDHIIAAQVLYGRTRQLLQHMHEALGISVTFVDATNVAAVRAARTTQTKLFVVETISNPLMEVADLQEIKNALGEIPIFVDATFTTPCLLRPLELGATYVCHSASKYLNGHGDAMLGVVVGSAERIMQVKLMISLLGTNSNPFESWLGCRGLRTLPLRMRQVSQTAYEIAGFLDQHPAVSRVYYPGLSSHAGHEVARRQFDGQFGGMLAFEVRDGAAGVARFFDALQHIPFSPTLADTRTTVSYPSGTSHSYMTAEQRLACGIADGLVRLSIGLESSDDLRDELSQALSVLCLPQRDG